MPIGLLVDGVAALVSGPGEDGAADASDVADDAPASVEFCADASGAEAGADWPAALPVVDVPDTPEIDNGELATAAGAAGEDDAVVVLELEPEPLLPCVADNDRGSGTGIATAGTFGVPSAFVAGALCPLGDGCAAPRLLIASLFTDPSELSSDVFIADGGDCVL